MKGIPGQGHYLIVGATRIAEELICLLPDNSTVVIVDEKPAHQDAILAAAGDRQVTFIRGDATSALVLEEAGVADVDWVICLIPDDRKNLEVCTLVRERFHIRDVISIVQSRESLQHMHDQSIHPIFENRSIALSIQSILYPGKHVARGVGLEAGELMEVLVLPSSPIVGVPLSVIQPKTWILAAIYRKDQVIIPHGQTIVESGDRVLIVGDPQSLPLIADFIHRGQPGFPLSFGADVLITDSDRVSHNLFAEGCYLLNLTQSVSGTVLSSRSEGNYCSSDLPEGCCKHLDWPVWDGSLISFLEQKENIGKFGLLIIPSPTKPSLLRHMILGLESWESTIVRSADCPVLISRGTFPYQRVLLAISPEHDPLMLGTSALELTLLLKAELTAVTVTPPDLVIGRGAHKSQTIVLDQFRKLAAAYGLYPEIKPLIGNPVRVLRELAADFDVAVISHSLEKKVRFLNPDASNLLMHSLPCSTLIIPDHLSRPGYTMATMGSGAPSRKP